MAVEKPCAFMYDFAWHFMLAIPERETKASDNDKDDEEMLETDETNAKEQEL